jgi:peptidoglycan/LPS O-acetylase OafA/YrhL
MTDGLVTMATTAIRLHLNLFRDESPMSHQRMTEIDGLRGLAALSVMCGHWCEFLLKQNPPAGWGAFLQSAVLDDFSFGRLGIVAFFCVSGFVVPFSFRGDHPLVSFPISRIFRLYPAYWASIFTAVLILPLVGAATFGTTQILANLTMIQLALGQGHVLGVYWTLFIEIMFYAICYALFFCRFLYSGIANFIAMCLFLGLALTWAAMRWNNPELDLPVGVPTYLAAMHFGTLARLRTQGNTSRNKAIFLIALPVLLIGATSANVLAYFRAENELVGWVAASLGYIVGVGLFLLALARMAFKGKVFAYLGLISYSMYLFHMITIGVIGTMWPGVLGWELASVVTTLCYFTVTILVAMFVHRFVEQPAIGLGRQVDAIAGRVAKRLTRRA